MFVHRNRPARLAIAATVVASVAGAVLMHSTPAVAAEETSKEQILAGVERDARLRPDLPARRCRRRRCRSGSPDTPTSRPARPRSPPKTKYLISLAVAAQIPCQYCIWADTLGAKAAGATDEEIGEAVGVAAMTRFWSTNFNGLQVDLATYQKELGPLFAGQ